MLNLITNNPYRILGVLSNSPLTDRVSNQNRLAAFAIVGREVSFPNDFTAIIPYKPGRTSECISAACTAINLDRDKLKFSLFWFVNGTPIDGIAIEHLQAGNIDKAKELFQRQEKYSSLINRATIAFIEDDVTLGFSNISKVIHNSSFRSDLLIALGISNLNMTEDEIARMFIDVLIKEIPANKLLLAATNPNDKAIISKIALDKPISEINSAIATAKAVDHRNANASLAAGTQLMKSTKKPLKQVKDIAGATSPQYQMVADNIAKQILQCGINYYNNAPDSDVESPRKAIILNEYALKIAVGQLTKDRCQENYNILKRVVDNMPPAEVAVEVRKIKEELRKFCSLPDKISHSIALLNATKPLLQTIKTKLGASNTFYLSLSTQVVGNALHNLIEEVNQAQNYLNAIVEAAKKAGLDPAMLNYLGDEHSPAKIIDNKLKPVLREAWKATTIMDSFDMEAEFRTNRYNPNRQSLKGMCDSLGIPTSVPSPPRTPKPQPTPKPNPQPTPTPKPIPSSSDDFPYGCLVVIVIAIITFLVNALG